MGPEIWILVGVLGTATVLGLGFYLGWAFGDGERDVLEHQLATAVALSAELEAQAKTSREAAGKVLRTERGLAAASARGPVALAKYARLLDPRESVAVQADGETAGDGDAAAETRFLDEGA